MHCYEIIPSWKAWLCFKPWLGGWHFSTVGSGVTDGGQGCAPPPWQAKCKKWVPLWDFMNCRIRKCFYKFWKSVGLDVLNAEIVQCSASSNESKIEVVATACRMQNISRGLLFILPHFARPPLTPCRHPCHSVTSPVALSPPLSPCRFLCRPVGSLVGFPCQPVLCPWAKVFILSGLMIRLSSELERAISSVQNSTAGARHVWMHLWSKHLCLSFDLWLWHAIVRAWNKFKGHTSFQLWLASHLTHLFVKMNIIFFVLLCDVVKHSLLWKVLPRKQFWTPATECAWKDGSYR